MRNIFAVVSILGFTRNRAANGYFGTRASINRAIPLKCNRACLENVVEQYLTALVAHDPRRLPLSKDVKYTENAQLMEPGDGFWKTARRARELHAHFCRSRIRAGVLHGHDAGSGSAFADEPSAANRARADYGDREYFLQTGRRRTEQHR